MVAPDSAIPVGAVVVRVPPQTLAELLATVSPVGRVSVNATPVRGMVLLAGLLIVKFKDVVEPTAMVAGLNALAITGGTGLSTFTIAVACAVAPLGSTTVSSTFVTPTGYGPAGLWVIVSESPSGSDDPLSTLAFAVPPIVGAVTVTL